MRTYFGFGLLAVGLILAAIFLYDGQPVIALSLALAGGYAALGIFLGIGESWANPSFQLAAAFIGGIGLLGVFLHNRAFDTNLQGAYMNVLSDIVTIELRCRPMSTELRNMQPFGVAACASQQNSDQMGAVVELGKGLHFGPTLTLADSGVTLYKGEYPNYCARAFKATEQLCPLAFPSINKTSRSALLEAAK